MTVNITHFDGLSLEENVKNNFKQADMEAALAHILQTRYNAITCLLYTSPSPRDRG